MKLILAVLAAAFLINRCSADSEPGIECYAPKWVASTAGTVTNYKPKVRLVITEDTMDLVIKTDGRIKQPSGPDYYYVSDWRSFDDEFKKIKFVKDGAKLVSTYETIEDVQNPSIGNQYWYKHQTTKTLTYNTLTYNLVEETAYKNYGGPEGKVYNEFFKIVTTCK